MHEHVDVVRRSLMRAGNIQRVLFTTEAGRIVAPDDPARAGLLPMLDGVEIPVTPEAVRVFFALLCVVELRRRGAYTEWEAEEEAKRLHARFVRLVSGDA